MTCIKLQLCDPPHGLIVNTSLDRRVLQTLQGMGASNANRNSDEEGRTTSSFKDIAEVSLQDVMNTSQPDHFEASTSDMSPSATSASCASMRDGSPQTHTAVSLSTKRSKRIAKKKSKYRQLLSTASAPGAESSPIKPETASAEVNATLAKPIKSDDLKNQAGSSKEQKKADDVNPTKQTACDHIMLTQEEVIPPRTFSTIREAEGSKSKLLLDLLASVHQDNHHDGKTQPKDCDQRADLGRAVSDLGRKLGGDALGLSEHGVQSSPASKSCSSSPLMLERRQRIRRAFTSLGGSSSRLGGDRKGSSMSLSPSPRHVPHRSTGKMQLPIAEVSSRLTGTRLASVAAAAGIQLQPHPQTIPTEDDEPTARASVQIKTTSCKLCASTSKGASSRHATDGFVKSRPHQGRTVSVEPSTRVGNKKLASRSKSLVHRTKPYGSNNKATGEMPPRSRSAGSTKEVTEGKMPLTWKKCPATKETSEPSTTIPLAVIKY